MNSKLYPKDWKEISMSAKQRAHFICGLCGKPASRKLCLTVHHYDQDTMNSDPANLVCLHSRCHLLIHTVYKGVRSQTDLEHLSEFLNKQLVIPMPLMGGS